MKFFSWKRRSQPGSEIKDATASLEYGRQSNVEVVASKNSTTSKKVDQKTSREDETILQRRSAGVGVELRHTAIHDIPLVSSACSSSSSSSCSSSGAGNQISHASLPPKYMAQAEKRSRSTGRLKGFSGAVGAHQIKARLAHGPTGATDSSFQPFPTREEVLREVDALSDAFTVAMNDSIEGLQTEVKQQDAANNGAESELCTDVEPEPPSAPKNSRRGSRRVEVDEERWARVFASFDRASAELDRALARASSR